MGGGEGGGGKQETASKTPWEPAIKPLTNSLNTGQDLERYYQQNPFNRLQQQGYQNQFADLDQFRSQTAPGLMAFANKLMGSNYQRASAGTEIGAMNPYAQQAMLPAMLQKLGNQQANGLLQTSNQHSMKSAMQASQVAGGGPGFLGGSMWDGLSAVPQDTPISVMSLLADPEYGRATGRTQGQPGAFSAPQAGQPYGLLDFAQLNPFTAANGIPSQPKPAADEKTIQQLVQEEMDRRAAAERASRRGNDGGA